jgi:hypothetical protein
MKLGMTMPQTNAPGVLLPSGQSSPEVGAAGVARSELLLSGNGAQALIDSVCAWSRHRFGARACELWAVESGRLRLLARHGQGELDASESLARRCVDIGQERIEHQRGAWLLPGERRVLGVLTLECDQPIAGDARKPLEEAVALLAQRLPAALELERLHRAVAQLAEAERLQRALYAIAELASLRSSMMKLDRH